MKHATLPRLLTLLIALLLLTACGASEEAAQDEHMDDDDHGGEAAGMDHMHVDAPAEFASLADPFGDDHEAIEAGEIIYETNCTTCHGPEGKGDGPAAEALDPQPATLADGSMMGSLSDGYLFWRVTKGGQMEPFNSAMPPWESVLTEDQRWQVISYVRTLAGDSDGHMEEDEHMEDAEHMEGAEHMEEAEHVEEAEHMEEAEHTDDTD